MKLISMEITIDICKSWSWCGRKPKLSLH